MDKTAAIVILFNPNEKTIENIRTYVNEIEKLFVIDNSSILSQYIRSNILQEKIVFIHNGKNEGIAKRLNQACELAIEEGFEYLLTMDQDSYFDKSSIRNYLNCIDAFPGKKNISMFGVNYEEPIADAGCNYSITSFLITSGSVVNLNAYKHIGPFDENLFIDFVDTEYCFRSILKGFEIIQFHGIFMHHSLGETFEKHSIKNLRKTKRSFHSPLRLYYMTRNYFYINSKYKQQFRKELSILKTDLLNRIKNKLLYNANRYTTFKYLVKAVKDYRKNNMGKQI
jgi:rhamnosyltransferase